MGIGLNVQITKGWHTKKQRIEKEKKNWESMKNSFFMFVYFKFIFFRWIKDKSERKAALKRLKTKFKLGLFG